MRLTILTIIGVLALSFTYIINGEKTAGGGVTKDNEYYDLSNSGLEEAEDATPIVVQALEICKEKGYAGIKFPKGTFHFYPTYAPDFYCAITNNDNGLKRTPFPIIDFKNFHLDGGGSDFIFHGRILPFIIENSSGIAITDLNIDWEVPFFVQGTVTSNNERNKTFDIRIETPYEVSDGLIYLTTEKDDSPYELKHGKKFSKQEKYHQRLGQNIFWDRSTQAPLYDHRRYSGFEGNVFFEATSLSDDQVRLKTPYEQVPPVGTVFISKGEYLFNRQSPGFRIFKSKDLQLRNINVYHAGAMGLIAERSEDITLDSFNVVLREGTNRLVTTIADATHFCNCKGLVTIKNCTFENMLDDATNIHGTYARVNKILNDNQIAFETYHPHQKDYLFGEEGDSVRIVDQKTLLPKTQAMVIKKVKRINEKISILTLSESIKGKVEQYDGIENLSWSASAIIENNIVRNNRARGFLISTSHKVLVKNNFISSQMAGILVTGDLDLWNESGPCDSLIIEHNRFVNNIHGGNKQSIIQISPEQNLAGFEGDSFYSKDIIIRNNEFQTFDSPVLTAKSVDGFTFQDNKVIQTDLYKPLFPGEPNLKIENCRDVVLQDNTYQLLTGKTAELTLKGDYQLKDNY